MKLLSTKILTPEQFTRLAASGVQIEQYDSLTITLSSFKIPQQTNHCIFTSQNAAQAFLNNLDSNQICTAYCVGERAALLLSQNGHNIAEIGENSANLAQKIIEKHKNQQFLYFSGNLRRPELPLLLTQEQIAFKEIQAYTTHINYKQFNTEFDAILYYSPSGVESFHKHNSQTNYTAVCIGQTTANQAKQYTASYNIALHTTVAGVLDAAIKLNQLSC